MSLTKHLFAFLLPVALFASATSALGAPTTDSGVSGRATVHGEHTYNNHGHIHVGSQHISVPSTHAGVNAFKVRMPWGGHIKVPGVHVRSPHVGVSSPRVDFR
ncbi:MAG TPA: hypothetical protein VGD50_05840, partial [Candidatus Baltobacteraceae bacterium]